jgi:hypothetical protein
MSCGYGCKTHFNNFYKRKGPGTLVFGKAKTMSWPLVLFFGGLNSLMAFTGGFEARLFSGSTLKIVLTVV